jgi:hypothetical protein
VPNLTASQNLKKVIGKVYQKEKEKYMFIPQKYQDKLKPNRR